MNKYNKLIETILISTMLVLALVAAAKFAPSFWWPIYSIMCIVSIIYAISNYKWSNEPEASFEADENGYKVKVSNSAFFILVVPLIGYFITPKDIVFSVQCSYKNQFLDLSATKIKFFTGAKAEEQVFQSGLARFQVSNQYSGDKIKFQIDTTSGFTLINPDSAYEIQNNKTFELPLKKLLKFRLLTGRVTDEYKPSAGLGSVEISFKNTVHYSNDDGNFTFAVSENEIAEAYLLTFKKTGYEYKEKEYISGGNRMLITLKRTPKNGKK